jgi:transcriptional regulator with XRE-family HTH domain
VPQAQERLGFFNARLCQRMNELDLSTRELASRVDLTYEPVRKLRLGHCLPSPSALERLCALLRVGKRDMSQRVARDRMIFKFGDAAWAYWGINPMAAPLYIFFPLLTKEEQEIFRLQIIAFVEAKKRRVKEQTERAA